MQLSRLYESERETETPRRPALLDTLRYYHKQKALNVPFSLHLLLVDYYLACRFFCLSNSLHMGPQFTLSWPLRYVIVPK